MTLQNRNFTDNLPRPQAQTRQAVCASRSQFQINAMAIAMAQILFTINLIILGIILIQ